MSEKGRLAIALASFIFILTLNVMAAPTSAAPSQASMENIAKKIFPSVVTVEARDGFKKVATGVVIDKDGYIVTTALISPRDQEILVTTADGKSSQAKFLGFDPETNLALIQAKDKNLSPISLGTAAGLVPGTWIGLIGISPENTPQVSQGIVSSVSAERLRLNIWVTRGASGSPVVNNDGQMVGLLRGIYAEDQPVVFEFREKEVVGSGYVFNRAEAPSSGMALAIPVDIVRKVATEIKETGKVSRGWVGVSISENEQGQVEIMEVEKESPAELAGLKEGDILLTIDGKKISDSPMFVSEVRSRKPGQDVKLGLERDGKKIEAKVKLGEYPEAEAKRALELRFPRLFPALPEKPAQPEKPGQPERAPGGRFDIYSLPRTPQAWPAWAKRKYIGVYLESINKDLLDFFGVKEDNGLLVNQVTKDSPAEKAGLKVGDVIVRADGKKLTSISDLSAAVQNKKKGDKVKLDLVRDKKSLSLEVEVSEEESPGLSYFFDNVPYEGYWGDFSREMQRQFDKSRDTYEKYSQESQEKLKKMNEELTKKSQEMYEKSKEIYEKNRDYIKKYTRLSNRAYYRV
jgi:serine protease Do